MKAFTPAVAWVAVAAPALHLLSDVLEWVGNGFSRSQLLVNYAAFVPMPFLLLGLHAVQTPRAGWRSLTGALLYGAAFVYFTHTTLLALEESTPDYAALWGRLGAVYTLHGALMILGGALFGLEAWKARVLSRSGVGLFLLGLGLNLAVALAPLPEIIQTAGSTVRNAGLIWIGASLLRDRAQVPLGD